MLAEKINKYPAVFFLVGFILLAIALRFLSFQYTVIDHDESSYLVIAQEILDGKILYVDVWDTKPVGIFLIFAAIIKIFGHSIFAIRLFASLFIGFTSFFLFLSLKRWGKKNVLALIGGLSYLLFCSVHKWNFAANTEIFFNLFTAIALFFFSGKKNNLHFFLSGLFIGIGFIIKYFVLFDLAAFWLFYVFVFVKKEGSSLLNVFKNTISMGLGFIIPFTSVFFYYYFSNYFEEFVFVSFVLPRNYINNFNITKVFLFFSEFYLVYIPFIILFIIAIFKGKNRTLVYFSLLWFAMIWIIILLPGKFFHHYYFQLLLPLAFLIPEVFNTDSTTERFLRKHYKIVLAIFLSAFVFWNVGFQYTMFFNKTDHRKEVARYLNKELKENDILYCNYSSVIYFLTKKSPPQKYIHPTLLSKEEHINAIKVDVDKEAMRVINKKPSVLVIQGGTHRFITNYISIHCFLVNEIEDDVRVYRRF